MDLMEVLLAIACKREFEETKIAIYLYHRGHTIFLLLI